MLKVLAEDDDFLESILLRITVCAKSHAQVLSILPD